MNDKVWALMLDLVNDGALYFASDRLARAAARAADSEATAGGEGGAAARL